MKISYVIHENYPVIMESKLFVSHWNISSIILKNICVSQYYTGYNFVQRNLILWDALLFKTEGLPDPVILVKLERDNPWIWIRIY